MPAPYYFVALSFAYYNYQYYLSDEETGKQYPYQKCRCGIKILNSAVLLFNSEVDISRRHDFIIPSQSLTLENSNDKLSDSLLTSNGQRIKN